VDISTIGLTLEFADPARMPTPFERRHIWRYMPVIRGSTQEGPTTGVVVGALLDSLVAQVEFEEPLGENKD
jgi:hypothetical protein